MFTDYPHLSIKESLKSKKQICTHDHIKANVSFSNILQSHRGQLLLHMEFGCGKRAILTKIVVVHNFNLDNVTFLVLHYKIPTPSISISHCQTAHCTLVTTKLIIRKVTVLLAINSDYSVAVQLLCSHHTVWVTNGVEVLQCRILSQSYLSVSELIFSFIYEENKYKSQSTG